MAFRPLYTKVLIRPDAPKDRTEGGLYLPESAQDKPIEGTVVAVGPGARKDDGTRDPLDVKEGDHVLYSKYGGTEIKIDDENLLIVDESSIYGVH